MAKGTKKTKSSRKMKKSCRPCSDKFGRMSGTGMPGISHMFGSDSTQAPQYGPGYVGQTEFSTKTAPYFGYPEPFILPTEGLVPVADGQYQLPQLLNFGRRSKMSYLKDIRASFRKHKSPKFNSIMRLADASPSVRKHFDKLRQEKVRENAIEFFRDRMFGARKRRTTKKRSILKSFSKMMRSIFRRKRVYRKRVSKRTKRTKRSHKKSRK